MSKLRIVADENIPWLQEFFGSLGRIETYPGRSISAEQVRNADVLLVRSVTRVGPELIERSRLKFVGTCTIGTDHLDFDALKRQGIAWSGAPGCNANSVVEYIFSALARVKPDWLNTRVGIIGCGNVGGALQRRLRALNIPCRCYDPFLSVEQNADLGTLEEVLAAPVICVHAPLTTAGEFPTLHLLDEGTLRRLRAGTVLISAGRGAVIDNQALKRVLRSGQDLAAVLDVWEPEPDIDVELLQLVALGTPHIAGYSFDGKVAGTAMIYRALCCHLGIQPQISQQQLADAGNDLMREIKLQGRERQALLNEAIVAAYDICEDDFQLRQLQSMNSGRPEYFDLLRKNYRRRREFPAYNVNALAAAESERAGIDRDLLALGFRVNSGQASSLTD